MNRRIIVTGGAIIKDKDGRILVQKRSDYGDWGLPGGGMEAGESIEETMIREVYEETGLEVKSYELYAVYSGKRMEYTYPDGNQVVFVMFLFDVIADFEDKVSPVDQTLLFEDPRRESLQLKFMFIDELELTSINLVQRPVFEDLLRGESTILRQ